VDEHQFDTIRSWRPFETKDVQTSEKLTRLAIALWGRTAEDLRRQLAAPTPAVPHGCTLSQLQQLERLAEQLLSYYHARVSLHPNTLSHLHPHETITINGEQFNLMEARREIARRAVRHFRNPS
jgi:cytosine/adenosine deaminase-related metal-dependent hydrolase